MFTERAKLTALAIVHILETAKPFGDYSAVAVLNDGAGVSYGINQFTHRSGSLYKVINTYLGSGGEVGAAQMEAALPALQDKSAESIQKLSRSRSFKDALTFAGATHEMKLAQQQIAENMYLTPAIEACEGSGFVQPLSLAVIYDSINHGSYGKIRDRVSASDKNEKAWITEYVQDRDNWLESIGRLAVTDYRTDFFLAQIARGNWKLALPLNVHGHRLTDDDIDVIEERLSVGEPLAELTDTEIETAVEAIQEVKPAEVPVEQAPAPLGDLPSAEPSVFMKVADWKPWAVRWVSRIWKVQVPANLSSIGMNAYAAIQDPANWGIYAAIAGVLLMVFVGFAVFASLVIGGIYMYQNRGIAALKVEQLRSFADPNRKNIGLDFVAK